MDIEIETRLSEIERRLSVSEELLRQLLAVHSGIGASTREMTNLVSRLQHRLDTFTSLLGRVHEVLGDIKFLVDNQSKAQHALERVASGIAAFEDELRRTNKILDEEAAKLTSKPAVIDGAGS